MKKILLVMIGLASIQSYSQDSTNRSLTISGYVEAYYQYDFNKPFNNNRPGFIYSHNRHNEFNLNLGYFKANYESGKLRANLALATGTYMNANYVAEPATLKNIFEANGGIRLSKKKLWLDAGIFSSHIGFESAISKDCWNLTRSILADNSPYFEAGVKITYSSDNDKWLLCGLALNGWQRITRLAGNSRISWGTQIQFKPSGKLLFNYSNFIGTDKPDSARLSRLFHNIYGIFNITEKFGLTLGFDMGKEEKNTWYSPIVIARYSLAEKWAIAGRFEHYNDKNGVIVTTGTPNGFQTTGYSVNIDHIPAKNVLLRLEARDLNNNANSFFITSSLAVSF